MYKLLGVLLLGAFSAASLPAQSNCKECTAQYAKLRGLVTQHVGDVGFASSLNSKLDASERTLDREQNDVAVNILEAFKNEVGAVHPCLLPSEGADELIDAADILIGIVQPCL